MSKLAKNGVITIAFDDAYLDTYKYAIKYLDKLHIKSTIAVPSGLIGKKCEKRPVMGVKELMRAIKAGHEIASHALTHKNLYKLIQKDKKRAFSEIVESKRDIERLLKYKVYTFVFPYMRKNISRPLFLKAKSNYKSVRVVFDKPCFENIPPRDPHDLIGFAIMEKHTLSYLNKLVDHAQKKNLWLIEVYHLVGRKNTPSAHRPKPYRFFMHIDDFKKHIDYILSKNITILTQKEVAKDF